MLAYTMPIKSQTVPFIDGIGYTDDIDKARFGPGQRNHYTAHYVIKGKGYYNGNVLTRGDGFLVSPGMFEEYYPDEKDPWGFLWFTSPEDSMREVYKYYKAEPDTGIFRFDPIAVTGIVNEVIGNGYAGFHQFKVTELFLRLFCSHIHPGIENEDASLAQIYIDYAQKYIKANIHMNITVDELTKQLGISQPHLYRLFKGHFNMSPKEYIMDQKISSAKKMLLNTNMTVTQIAYSVGYADALTFSKMFSQKEGISPKKYREMLRG